MQNKIKKYRVMRWRVTTLVLSWIIKSMVNDYEVNAKMIIRQNKPSS